MRIGGLPQQIGMPMLSRLQSAAGLASLVSAAKPDTLTGKPMSGAVSPHLSVEMLIAVAAATAKGGRQEKIRLATSALDHLEHLRRALLQGRGDRAGLDALSSQMADLETTEDPALAALFDDIHLRVQVELAKLDLKA